VLDYDAIAALMAANRVASFAFDGDIFDAVARSDDLAIGCRQNMDVCLLCHSGRQPEIDAVVTVVSQRSAHVVRGRRTWIDVHVVLDETCAANFAGQGQLQFPGTALRKQAKQNCK
jgi:hypothetical protein